MVYLIFYSKPLYLIWKICSVNLSIEFIVREAINSIRIICDNRKMWCQVHDNCGAKHLYKDQRVIYA